MRAILSGIVLSGLLWSGVGQGVPAPVVRDLSAARWRAAVAAVAPGSPVPSGVPAVRDFFARLTPAQRLALARAVPDLVGNLDGVPVELRYTVNEQADPDSTGVPGRLLGYDPRSGHAIVVFGDLSTARHIAVLVPGVGWRLDNLLGPDGEAGNHPLAAGAALFDEARRVSPGTRVAVVVWLGYSPPAGIDLDAARSERAVAGVPALREFVAGLPAGADVTLLCHSYGAVLCGRAAPGLPVADLVALAAPGLDVSTVEQLHTAARVWAARVADDPIRFVPPVRIDGFGHGADPLATGARTFLTGTAHGHDGYFAPGTESLTNLARITLGLTGAVTRDNAGNS
ncbi:MAG TPA: alpha/beta hydrolase [Rugosimonospora sp.]|nr:alpha/beta hydrolase [Rugosimonospora sp.]